MGQFSWITSDTQRSVSNITPFPVYVLCPDGEIIEETDYEGYGIFGGRDIYQLVAEWNCPEKCNGDVDHDRRIGISIACYDEDNAGLEFPIKIVEDVNLLYGDVKPSPGCPNQGWVSYKEIDD